MNYVRFESPFWLFIGVLVLIELGALSIFIYKNRAGKKRSRGTFPVSPEATATPDGGKMAVVIERLRDGEIIDDASLRRMSAEDKALFEVQLIDALTKWPREDQHQLRSALIKQGYDEQCARRVMRESVADRVRASTLLSLLRPQYQARTGDLVQRSRAESATLGCSADSEGPRR
jgi:hypothetical protein